MNKTTFASLKLKINNEVTELDYNGFKIEVLHYLPIEDKYNLIMLALQNSKLEGIYNPIKLSMYFNLYTVYMYSNLTFTEKQREDESKLYDILESNGLTDLILSGIPEDEYEDLCNLLEETQKKKEINERSISGIINNVIESLPKNAEAMQDIIENFDESKFQNVLDFAKAANGGRDIN